MTRCKLWCTAVALSAFAVGCEPHSGTETDNPVMEPGPEPPPPPYESPIEWNPNDPGVPGCPGPGEDTGPTRGPEAALASGDLVVGVDRPLGLFVVDVSDPSEPRLRGTLPLGGYAVAAHESNVAVLTEEWAEVPSDRLPSPAELDASTLRLVHVDVSDPNNPRRVGDVNLEGEPWRTFVRDGIVWSMRATLAEEEPSCNLPWQTCSFPVRTELVVEGYRFTDRGFERVEAITLPMNQRAWLGHDGFVSATSVWEDRGEVSTGMYVARFDGEQLGRSELAGELAPAFLTPVGVEGNLVLLFSGEERFTLHVMDASGPELVELASVPDLPMPRAESVHFTATEVFIAATEPTASGVVVDFSDPAAPSRSALPPGVAMAVPLDATRWLGWGDHGGGVWSVGVVENGALGQVATTSFPSLSFVQSFDPFYVPNVAVAGDHVAFPMREYDAWDVRNVILTIDTSTDPVTVTTRDAHAEALFATDAGWAMSDAHGVGTVAFDGTSGSVDFGYRTTTDVALVGNRVATLEFGLRTSEVVLSRRDGTELGRIAVPGTAERLLSVDGWVVVQLANESSSCEQSGGSDCDERGLLVVDPVALAVSARVQLPAATFEVPSDRVTVTEYVRPPLELGSGEWVVAIERGVTCSYVADCEALGIEARSFAEAGIVPGTLAPCPPEEACPEPPPPPEVHGTRGELWLYRFEVDDGGTPRLSELGRSFLELQDSSFGDLASGKGEVLVTRRELQRAPGQPSKGSVARFMLDRFAIDGSSMPEPVNVPGYAAGTSDDGSVFTIEPGSDDAVAATLHRLRITGQGAYVEASRSFPGRYGGVHVSGDFAYYVGKGSDGCAMGFLQPIALDDELMLLDAVDLPGSEWTIVAASDKELLLGGPNHSGVALFDTRQAEVALRGYFRASPERARLFAGEVWAAADQAGVQHLTPGP